MTVTRFDGATLPAGWSSVEPAAGHVIPDDVNGYLRLTTDAGADYDSLSGTITVPQGPRIILPVSGSFDYAIALANAVNVASNQGIDVLAMDEPNLDGIRFAQYVTNISGREASWFGRRHTPSADANLTLDTPGTPLWGPRGWMRLTWDDATDTFTFQASHSGKPGTWHQLLSLVDTFVPTSFQVAMTAFGPDANPREMRLAVFVDMDGRGDDATTPPAADPVRNTVLNANLGGTSLPAELTSTVANSGTVNVGGGVVTMTTEMSIADSYAWIEGPDTLPVNHGMLLRYHVPQPSVINSFAGVIIRAANTTDLPAGSTILTDKFRPGTGFLAEINGSGSFGDIFRLLTAHPVAVGENFDGGQEFYGFSMINEDLTSPIDGSDGLWLWLRIEQIGAYYRSRAWYDGSAEPSTWFFEGEDYTQRGTNLAISWGHNDGTSGGTSTFEFDVLEAYEVVVETVDPEAVDLFTLQGGVEVPVDFYAMLDGIERPVDVTAKLTP